MKAKRVWGSQAGDEGEVGGAGGASLRGMMERTSRGLQGTQRKEVKTGWRLSDLRGFHAEECVIIL